MCMCVHACLYVCVRERMCACMNVCACACVCVGSTCNLQWPPPQSGESETPSPGCAPTFFVLRWTLYLSPFQGSGPYTPFPAGGPTGSSNSAGVQPTQALLLPSAPLLFPLRATSVQSHSSLSIPTGLVPLWFPQGSSFPGRTRSVLAETLSQAHPQEQS